MISIKELIINNPAVFISAISTLIAAVSATVAIVSNIISQKHYKNSMLPQLSMKLVNYNNVLYLQIKNTGRTVARNVNIKPLSIKNNGQNNDKPYTSGLFSMNFELYPEETVQSEVGLHCDTICTSSFPQLYLEVEYSIDGIKKKTKYCRTVTFAPAYDNKVVADINIDNRQIEQSLKSISRSSVRTANYLDGRQVAAFDELDILANKSLENDLLKILGKNEEKILSRPETIDESISHKNKVLDNDKMEL